MRKNPLNKGIIMENAAGIGTVTSAMVEARARELAAINGHPSSEPSEADYQQAKRELTGESETDPQEESRESIPESEGWDAVPGSTGRQAAGGATAAITVVGAVVGELAEAKRRKMMSTVGTRGRWSATHALPNAGAAIKPVPGTRPEFTPLERHYRIDINTIPPAVNEEQWRLNITGLVEQPLALTLDELRRYEPLHQFITLRCISNPVGGDLIGTTRWTGVSLQRLLPDLRLKPGASHLKMHAADGFFEVVPIETIKADERVMLTYAWDGVPLLTEHGFPLRIYIPNVCGMKQPKWITAIEVIDDWEPGYWVVRGWNKEAVMEATSVIDVVAMDMDIIQADQRKMIVPIGGIAHTGARGVSKVELQVDNGPWQPALLRTPLSHLTWVIWRYEWPFQHGNHTFTVRCWDGQGVPQIVAQAPPEPNGATGLYSKTQMF
jgi:DMSO/TMAO reductase YedYZ molybdopterin-dependent catalytic subunit